VGRQRPVLAVLGVYEEFSLFAGKTVDQMPDGMAN
jgi:hypothetical protein